MFDRRLRIATAASLAIAGMTVVASPSATWADDAKTSDKPPAKQQDQTSENAKKDAKAQKKEPVLIGVITIVPIPVTDVDLPKGVTFDANIPDAPDMRDTLAEVTEAAFTKEGFNDLVERMVDMDRNRIGEFAQKKFETLDGRIAQLQKAWKDKYGQDFDIREAKVYAPVSFAQGKIDDASAFASNWPVDPSRKDDARPAGAKVATDRVSDQGNIEKGREVGIVRLPAQFGLPALNVSFIDEAYGWKIDVPNNVSGQQLHDNLLKHLTYVGEHMDTWPADVNDAYRFTTHHVLMGLYGLDLPSADAKAQKG